jgi:hypothetical protein
LPRSDDLLLGLVMKFHPVTLYVVGPVTVLGILYSDTPNLFPFLNVRGSILDIRDVITITILCTLFRSKLMR